MMPIFSAAHFFRTAAGSLVAALLLLSAPAAHAQTGAVGIGTTAPNASAVLDLTATGKGLLVPRMDSVTRVGIAAPATGLLVFQTNGRAGFWYYNNGWLFLPDKSRSGDNLGNHTATQNLNLGTNALTGSGADLGSAVGVGVTAGGGLNIGQNARGNNVLVGYRAGQATTTGFNNQFVGYLSGYTNTGGSFNHFAGYQSGYFNTTGNRNLFSGYQSGYSNTSSINNQFIGYRSGYSNTTGNNNEFAGYQSGYSNTTGKQNYFSGYQSGYSNTTATNNHFEGYQSGYNNTTGEQNYFSGNLSGYFNTTGSYNTFTGLSSGQNNDTGSYNVFSGIQSGAYNTIGNNNTGVGYMAGPTVGYLTNANAFGYNARVSQDNSLVLGGTGADAVQVGIGTTAPRGTLDVAGTGNTYLVNDPNAGTANQSVFLPGHVFLAPFSPSDATAYVQARIPTPTTSTNLSMQLRTMSNGTIIDALRLNPNGSATFRGTVTANGVTLSSDARFKTQVRPLTGALASVQRLRGVRYQWNALGIQHGGTAGAEQIGLLAQELEKVYPELVLTDAQGYKSVNYAQLTPVLLEALKELAARNAALETKNATLETQVQQQQASLGSFEQRLRALEAGSAQASTGK